MADDREHDVIGMSKECTRRDQLLSWRVSSEPRVRDGAIYCAKWTYGIALNMRRPKCTTAGSNEILSAARFGFHPFNLESYNWGRHTLNGIVG